MFLTERLFIPEILIISFSDTDAFKREILWNHTNIFMDSLNFTGLWERNFLFSFIFMNGNMTFITLIY